MVHPKRKKGAGFKCAPLLLSSAYNVPGDTMNAADTLLCELIKGGGREVKVELRTANAFVDNLDRHGFALD
jgi:hypothetical protein